MPQIEIPTKEAKKRYPKLVRKIVKELKTFHARLVNIDKLQYSISWGINHGSTLPDTAGALKYRFPDVGTAKQRAEDYCARVTWGLRASYGHAWSHVYAPADLDMPKEIYRYALNHATREVEREQELAHLTPEEQKDYEDKLLRELFQQRRLKKLG